jgi:aminopeptidase Y
VLVANSGCNASDYPPTLAGSIAFIRRGACPFSDKSALAGKAGAFAAVAFNNEDGVLGGTLGVPLHDHVATIGISGLDAAPFVMKLEAGQKIKASVFVDATITNVTTTNVIAQTTEGDEYSEGCIMLGGHSDSVGPGPGINDDGSGIISLIEVATQLAKFTVKNCVRFAWWAAEEEGRLGSDYYVAQLTALENQKIRMFMDYDMMASPNYAYQIYNSTNSNNPVGSEELRNLYVAYYKDRGLNYTFIEFDGHSDYDAFVKNGIPGGGIATGAGDPKTVEEVWMFGGTAGDWYDPCHHKLCDDVSNLAMDAFEVNTKVNYIQLRFTYLMLTMNS